MNDKAYRTVHKSGSGEIQEKKSRFLSFIMNVENEEQIQDILEKFRKQYWDARHVCYAYVLHSTPLIQRFSDDGEPQGTAGKPMLELLSREGLENALLIVVRYFGGVLLGTGGLLRAYTDSSREAMANAVFIDRIPGYMTEIKVDYATSGKIPNLLSELSLTAVDTEYSDGVTYTIPVPVDEFDRFSKQIVDMTRGALTPEKGPECFFGYYEGECIIF